MRIEPKPNVPNVPIWFSPDRTAKAVSALNACTSLMEWATVNPENLPYPQHENLEIVAAFVSEIVQSTLHALERVVKEHQGSMHIKPPNDKPESR